MPWVEKKTMDGLVYWYDPSTKAATWEKPFELRSAEERADDGDWTWVPHAKDFWQPARIVNRNADGSVDTQTKDGKTLVVPANKKMNDSVNTDGREQLVPLWPLKQYELNHIEDDLIMLQSVNDGSIIYNLRAHFAKQGLYTWVGASHRVLISINPYQRLPIYEEDSIRLHRDKSPNIEVPPHIFDISDGSYNEMLFDGKHQSILISGESGAGKTEATKQCLKYWARVAGSKNGVEERLIQANPVLEAYGNAKTIRNNNSSRFGKWVEVYFDQNKRSIDGAVIINYLLEKSRLVFQQGGERNFHIFYQLLNDSQAKQEYQLRDAKSHKLVSNGLTGQINGVDDRKDFADAKQAMSDLQFTGEEKEWCLRLPAALLHLGDITFAESVQAGNVKGSKIADEAPLKLAAKFLDVDPEALRKVLLTRTIVVNRDRNVIPLNPQAARAGCDSIVKGIYSRQFDWIVARCNKALNGETSGKFIGVLDIFGFEIFEVNSFEQLCINYCNEKLQQLFNIETFRDEEQLYKDEGIKFDPITFVDSDPVLAMIEKGPNGILPVLDDECKLPEGSDNKYMDKINKSFASHPSFGTATARKLKNQLSFDVIHYAGSVSYTADEFMSKNKDTFFQDAHDMAASSNNALTKSLFPPSDTRLQVKSLSSVFRSQLNVLMDKLRTTSTRYVRCIKPNETMSAMQFESPLVMRQLRYSGVFEAVAIRKQGYPFRQKFAAFAFRYRSINPDHVYRESDPRKVCEEILAKSPSDFADVVFGKSMVFYRAGIYKTLKLLRNLALETIIPRVQGILRGSLARTQAKRVKLAEKNIDHAISLRTDYNALKSALGEVDQVLGAIGKRVFPRVRPRNEQKGKEYLIGLQVWMDEEINMSKVIETSVSSNYAGYWDAFERCQKILHVARSPKQTSLYDQIDSAIRNSEQGQLDMGLVDANKKMLRPEMKAGVVKAQSLSHNSPPVREAQRLLALPPKQWYEQELQAAIQFNDLGRQTTCKYRLWEIEMFASGAQYERWGNFGGLKDPKDYAKGKWFGKASCAEGMCFGSKDVINSALSKADGSPEFKKQAKEMNKFVLAYAGVKKDPRGPDAAGADALGIAARSPQLKNELYLQLFKALTPNPKTPQSTDKAYELLGVALFSFLPEDAELAKHAFIIATKHDKKYAKAASNGKFVAPGAPRSGSDVTRIVGELVAFGVEGDSALALT
ncbi:hypothetical protein BASA81_002382 [Batrachochytrium salamandrivorans]|nr:hypothetical protein BASA81_002382 [Batrachochytrium salamandrivorans]